jgi:hypothetical protein
MRKKLNRSECGWSFRFEILKAFDPPSVVCGLIHALKRNSRIPIPAHLVSHCLAGHAPAVWHWHDHCLPRAVIARHPTVQSAVPAFEGFSCSPTPFYAEPLRPPWGKITSAADVQNECPPQ